MPCRRRVLVAAACALLAPQVDAQRPRDLHVYTFSDMIPHPGLCALAESVFELGGVLRVIGLSKRPGYILIHSHAPVLKFLMLQEVVEYEVSTGRVHEDDLMIFTDGHDVLLQLHLQELMAAYDKFPGSPYLISGEKNCWPWPHTDSSHGEWDPGMQMATNATWYVNRWVRIGPMDLCRVVPPNGPYRYPNVGLSMGPIGRFLEVLKRNNRIMIDEDLNDQASMFLVVVMHGNELNIVIDQKAEVFMSMVQHREGDLEREPCGEDWFREEELPPDSPAGSPRRPPRNQLTNTTPALLHFNGPSHEDSVWPTCYHTWTKEFRKVGRKHVIYDVDHDIMIGTDMLCDYSYYDIKEFHVHPVHGGTLEFLKDFYTLPVDPGLEAFRSSSDIVGLARFGKEQELHGYSVRIQEAMRR